MKFNIPLLAVALFVLTACANPGQLRQKAPDFDEVTNVPAERLAGCVGDKLEASDVGKMGGAFLSTNYERFQRWINPKLVWHLWGNNRYPCACRHHTSG